MSEGIVQEKGAVNKRVIFFADRKSKYILERKILTLPDTIEMNQYDDFIKAVRSGTIKEIVTSLAIALSPEIRQLGYRQYIVRNGKILELKEGPVEKCNIDLKDYQDFLKMFLNGDFDPYWE